MSQVGYNTPQYQSNRKDANQKESFLMRLVLRTGLVKSKKQANIVLLVMAGVFFLATLVVLSANGTFSSSGESNEGINYEEHAGSEEYMNME